MTTPYENLKTLQQAIRLERGRKTPVKDLIVLSPQNDPFYAGTEGQQAMAGWFADAFGGRTSGVHLRRLHYRLVARGDVVRADGILYENDANSWMYLNNASRFARYLGFVDPEDLVDRRNPSPHIYMAPGFGLEPEWSYEVGAYGLDRISTRLGNELLPPVEVTTEVTGYYYEEGLQPYHVEVWAEKTTMNDILVPLCRDLGANYVSGAGYQSITAMVSLLRGRVAHLEKPCRVLYVSDYDAAGRNMPKQMARQMEFWIQRYASEYDIRVEPIVMTAEQAEDYPPAPDTGAVELDAMEELTPGRLERIVSEHVGQFRDFDLDRKVHENARTAQEIVDEAVADAIADELDGVETIKGEAEAIYERYRARLEELAAELDAELEPLDERLETLQQAIEEKLRALEPDLPPLPEPEALPDDEDWLFDSRRDYMEQLRHYKNR
ncbi:MAG: hypothetical protein M3Q60_14930 [Actinomycetota bacterium]|nr:hypothetical protein [Actinomycetota bacterium]